MTAFFLAAAGMLLVALVLILVPLLRRRQGTTDGTAAALAPATISSVVAAIALPIAAGGLYLGITTYPWRGAPQAQDTPAAGRETIQEAIAKIEARLASHPDDATGWRMLGRSLVMAGQFTRAVPAYERAIALTGGLDPGLRLDLAEALVLANDPAAQTVGRQIADEVLTSDPANQKALWYSGVIALRADDPATARQRFAALLAQDPPGEIRGVLETQLATLGAAERGTAPAAAGPSPGEAHFRGTAGPDHPGERNRVPGIGRARQAIRAAVRLGAATRHSRPAARGAAPVERGAAGDRGTERRERHDRGAESVHGGRGGSYGPGRLRRHRDDHTRGSRGEQAQPPRRRRADRDRDRQAGALSGRWPTRYTFDSGELPQAGAATPA